MSSSSGKLSLANSLGKWLIRPASQWNYKSRGALKSAGLSFPFFTITLSMLLSVSAFAAIIAMPEYLVYFASTAIALLLFSLVQLYIAVVRTEHNLLVPLTHLRHWAMRMRGGNLAARIPETGPEEFVELAGDINTLSESLRALTKHMQDQVMEQTERVKLKNQSLETLYDVASCINNAHNLEELLTRFMHTMLNIAKADAACVRLLTDDGMLRMIASIGLDEQTLSREHLIALDACSCGKAVLHGRMECREITHCQESTRFQSFGRGQKVIAIPLQYRGETLGIYNLYVTGNSFSGQDEANGLLSSIGKHLGVAIAKSRLEKRAHRLSLMEERTLLSHELHDSLAQTLASLKMQVSVLDKNHHRERHKDMQEEIQNLYQGLDKANEELRELLGHFRTRMDERGLVPAIEECVRSFERENNISVFFQNEINGQSLHPSNEVQVLHIVQEALSNIRKHSQAHHARVLVKASNNGNWSVLIEDDGVGIKSKRNRNRAGKHIGINIMQERCKLLNGELSIDSEDGEGTRVELSFKSSPFHYSEAANSLFIEDTEPEEITPIVQRFSQ
ncbi:MAG: histidine kinase [Gammaproteobacteria bacterium]|nr:histidine kinase [Gammaproteobacteria bacterium]